MMTDRAVSDVVGYVLIFSLIVATVGVVTTVGFGTLDDRQTAEQINNAERAFDVFANNMENVYRDGSPSRATEIRLSGGTIQYGDPVTITIQNASDTSVNYTVRITPLVYTEGDTEIVYEGGAIIRDDGDGMVMRRTPPFRIGADRTLLPFVRTTRAVGDTSVSRDGTIRVESVRTNINTTTRQQLSDGGNLELVIESPRQEAWNRYLEEQAEEVGGTHNDGTLAFHTEELSVPRFRVQLRFIQ